MEKIVHTIAPVFDEESKVLLLGSMPSPKSREVGFYYGHPQNRFWRVLANVLQEELPQDITQKKQIVLKHHIALWDVLAECEIKGASDSSIRNPKINDLSMILTQAPIKAVFTTGAKAAELYRKLKQDAWPDCIKLPSTSAANAAYSLEKLIDNYRVILDYLED